MLSLVVPARASFSCRLTEQLGNPQINSNPNFWEDFGKIAENGSDRDLGDLLRKYGVDERSDAPSSGAVDRRAAAPAKPAFQMSRTAATELDRLPPGLRRKANDFLELARKGPTEMFRELRQNRGGWQLEKLQGEQGMSVRINQGYRVVFKELADHTIDIVRISKTATHGGH